MDKFVYILTKRNECGYGSDFYIIYATLDFEKFKEKCKDYKIKIDFESDKIWEDYCTSKVLLGDDFTNRLIGGYHE